MHWQCTGIAFRVLKASSPHAGATIDLAIPDRPALRQQGS